MTPVSLIIQGMHCGGCVNRVTTTLKEIPGVNVVQVNVGSAQLAYDPAQASPEAIISALSNAGYSATATQRPPVP